MPKILNRPPHLQKRNRAPRTKQRAPKHQSTGLQPLGKVNGGIYYFKYPSRSRERKVHYQNVDVEARLVLCSCEDFEENRAPISRIGDELPRLDNPAMLCFHLRAAVEFLQGKGLLVVAPNATHPTPSPPKNKRYCIFCNATGALHPLCDSNGRNTGKNICQKCVQARQNPDAYYPEEETPGYQPEY